MKTYSVGPAYPGNLNDKYQEIEILSGNLLYTELQDTHSGCQCGNLDNEEEIHKRCRKVAKLIREIDELNKKL